MSYLSNFLLCYLPSIDTSERWNLWSLKPKLWLCEVCMWNLGGKFAWFDALCRKFDLIFYFVLFYKIRSCLNESFFSKVIERTLLYFWTLGGIDNFLFLRESWLYNFWLFLFLSNNRHLLLLFFIYFWLISLLIELWGRL